jgi:hypothetical protein
VSIEDDLKAEVRLYALETLVCLLYATLFANDPPLLARLREKALERSRGQTFPSLDPAMSDFVSAELEAAIDGLLARAAHFLETDQGKAD